MVVMVLRQRVARQQPEEGKEGIEMRRTCSLIVDGQRVCTTLLVGHDGRQCV